MTDYREILRLRGLQYSQRAIARSVRCSRNTVEKVLSVSAQLHLAWPLPDDVTNAELEQLLFPNKHKASSQYAEPDYPYIHRELARSGVTLTLLASHRRLQTRQRDPMVKREHMPPEHQKYLTYNADEFSRWAMSVGPMTEKVAEHFLKSGKAAEQGYKACAGLTKLEQRYGKQRLEAACGKALAYSTAPSLRTIASILKNGLDKPDKAESQLSQSKANSYGITRGAAYFRKGGDR